MLSQHQSFGQVSALSTNDVALAVDDSGSTIGDVMKSQVKLVVDPLCGLSSPNNFCDICPKKNMILWNSQSRFIGAGDSVRFDGGGTNPESIFTNLACRDFVKSKSIFVLCTDGQIDSQSVDNFSKTSASTLQNTPLVIGVMSDSYPSPGKVNISVIHALMKSGRNCIVLGFDHMADCLRVIFCKGAEIEHQLKSQGLYPLQEFDETVPWRKFPVWPDWTKVLSQLKLSHIKIPAGHVVVRADEKGVDTADVQALLASDTNDKSVISWDWTEIINYIKANGMTDKLRMFLQQFQNRMVQDLQVSDETRQRRARINGIVNARMDGDPFDQKEFTKLMEQETVYNKEFESQVKADNKPIRQFCQRILADLCAADAVGWQLKDHLQSNRAKRAAVLDADPDPEVLLCDPTLKFLEVECQICYNTAPTAILLNPSDDDTFYTSDFAIDCPLACGYQAAKKFCNFHVCFNCARFFWAQKKDMYQRPVQGVLPVLASNQQLSLESRKLFLTTLQQSFAMGLSLNHGPLLMLAAVESLGSHQWSKSPEWTLIRKDLLDFLLDNVMTAPYFSAQDQGHKITVRQALLQIVDRQKTDLLPVDPDKTAMDYLMTKPLAMQLLMIRLLSPYSSPVELTRMLRYCLIAWVTTLFKTMDHEDFVEFVKFFQTKTFDHVYGVIQRNTIRTASFWDRSIVEALSKSWQRKNNRDISFAWETLKAHHATMPLVEKDMDAFWTCMLHSICCTLHINFSAPNSLVSQLMIQFSYGNKYLEYGHALNTQQFNFAQALPQFDVFWTKTDVFPLQKHSPESPPFYLNLGTYSCPNVTLCSCGFALLPPKQYYASLAEAAKVIREKRLEHFVPAYGSMYPGPKSYHVLMHSTVALVMTDASEDEKKNPTEAVFHHFNLTAGDKGDVFKHDLKQDVEKCIASFLKIQQEPSYALPDDDSMTRSLEYKVACTLHKMDLLQDGMSPLQFVRQRAGFWF